MIEVIKEQLTKDMSREEKLNRAREFLQILILKILHDKQYFHNLAFVGGTALRVLFDVRRFSEDLDFCLTDKKDFSFSLLNNQLEKELRLFGLKVESKTKEEKTVQNSLFKFSELLKELELSPLQSQKLSIKLEIDSKPPSGWALTNTLVNKTYIFNIVHFDLPSMFASKLHACFFRKFTKGRDFYDFLWYTGKKTRPNFVLLNNAIKQTEGIDMRIQEGNFKDFLLKQIEKIDFAAAKKDVERFVEDKTELALFDKTQIKQSVENIY